MNGPTVTNHVVCIVCGGAGGDHCPGIDVELAVREFVQVAMAAVASDGLDRFVICDSNRNLCIRIDHRRSDRVLATVTR